MKTFNLFKQTATLGFIGSTVLFTPLKSQALTVEEVVNPQKTNGGWVTDMADKYLSKINCTFFDKVLDDYFKAVAITHVM